MSYTKEISENYMSLLNMCSVETAMDCIIQRSDELTDKEIEDVILSLRGEQIMREMGE